MQPFSIHEVGAAAMLPPRDITVARWADENRVLTGGAAAERGQGNGCAVRRAVERGRDGGALIRFELHGSRLKRSSARSGGDRGRVRRDGDNARVATRLTFTPPAPAGPLKVTAQVAEAPGLNEAGLHAERNDCSDHGTTMVPGCRLGSI